MAEACRAGFFPVSMNCLPFVVLETFLQCRLISVKKAKKKKTNFLCKALKSVGFGLLIITLLYTKKKGKEDGSPFPSLSKNLLPPSGLSSSRACRTLSVSHRGNPPSLLPRSPLRGSRVGTKRS